MFSVCTLLKVVGYYDLSVLYMSVMGFKKKFGWGWVGGVSSIQFFLDFWNCFNFAKPLTYLSNVFLLFFLQREFYKDLLKFLVAIVYDELLKAVHLQQGRNSIQNRVDNIMQYANMLDKINNKLYTFRLILF